MTREEICVTSFHLIQRSSAAKTCLIHTLDEASNDNYIQAKIMLKKANEILESAQSLLDSFEQQADKYKKEGFKTVVDYSYNHIMTTIVLRDYVKELISSQYPVQPYLPALYHCYRYNY